MLADLYEAATRQKSVVCVLCQDDCKTADPAITSLRDAAVRSAQQRNRALASTSDTNPNKSNRPAKVEGLRTSRRIGNAPGDQALLAL